MRYHYYDWLCRRTDPWNWEQFEYAAQRDLESIPQFKPSDHKDYFRADFELRILAMPSFGDHICHQFVWDSDFTCFVKRRWLRGVDHQIFFPSPLASPRSTEYMASLKPTIEEDTAVFPTTVIAPFVEMIPKCRPPLILMQPSPLGLDGTTMELTFSSGYRTESVWTWWCELPEEWKALDKIVVFLLEFQPPETPKF